MINRSSNEWQRQVLVTLKNDMLALFDSTEQASLLARDQLPNQCTYSDVEVMWNKGQCLLRGVGRNDSHVSVTLADFHKTGQNHGIFHIVGVTK